MAFVLTFRHGVEVVGVSSATTIDKLFTEARLGVEVITGEVGVAHPCFSGEPAVCGSW